MLMLFYKIQIRMQEFIIYQDELIKGHLINLLYEIPGFNMKRLLKLRLDMLNCLL